jgi:hypothetical protein
MAQSLRIKAFEGGNYKMTTHNAHRKKGLLCLFALVTITTLAVSYVALGAGPAFRNSGTFSSSSHGQHSFSHSFHRFGFFGGDGFDDQDVTITQPVQPAPSTEPEPAENHIYVPPRWVDGGYGVQISQPGYWVVPNQAAER